MSRRRVYNDDTIAIMGRFFSALDAVLEHRIVKNMSQYCEKYNIDRRHIHTQRNDLGRGYFEAGWLTPLINDCGISAQWLLTGKGTMFAQ